MSDFNDNDFDSFDDDDFDNFNSGNSFKDAWSNNPLLKLFVVIGAIVLIVSAIFIFGGSPKEEGQSRVSKGIDQSDTLGGEVSQQYAQAIEDVNQQRYEQAVKTGGSTIPMLVNPESQDLLTETDELPPYQQFDPLASFRATIQQEKTEEQEPELIEPEQVFSQPQGQQQVQAVPAPSPEAVQSLAQAMSQAAGNIINGHQLQAARIAQVTSKDYFSATLNTGQNAEFGNAASTQMVDTDGDGIPDTPLGTVGVQNNGDVVVQTIIVPAGTINYAQILVEANSDVPGPVLAQLVSGPLAGARLIGSFTVENKVLVLSFNTVVIDGLNQSINAVALDPNTTLPGVATEVDNRYLSRVILPAAASFISGVGAAIADNAGETTVTVSGDTVIEESTGDIDWEEQLGQGIEEGFDEIADFMDDEADDINVLVRVARGTPIGIFFLEPVTESNAQ